MNQHFYDLDNYKGFEEYENRLLDQSVGILTTTGIIPTKSDSNFMQDDLLSSVMKESYNREYIGKRLMNNGGFPRTIMEDFPHADIVDTSRLHHPYYFPQNRGHTHLDKKRKFHDDIRLGFPQQRGMANARERTRTHSVNDGFTSLRSLIPTDPPDRKLSKIETLRLAASYIWHLNSLLKNSDQMAKESEYNQFEDFQYVSCSCDNICTFCVSFLRSLKTS